MARENPIIPKIIHYAWFGGKPEPKSVIDCLETWKRYCPEYAIRKWDESNFDVSEHPYTREAYSHGKFAFVADYVRLYVLFKCGGIFLDTDVELIRSLDPLLSYPGFAGFEYGEFQEPDVALGLGVGAVTGNQLVLAMLEDYHDRTFVRADGTLDMTPCPFFQTRVLQSFGLILEDRFQDLGDMVILPTEFLCGQNYYTGEVKITSNTLAIHHYAATWMPTYRRTWHWLTQRIGVFRVLGQWRRTIQRRNMS